MKKRGEEAEEEETLDMFVTGEISNTTNAEREKIKGKNGEKNYTHQSLQKHTAPV